MLGIPGANNNQSEWTKLLGGLNICAWQEPDEAGEKFIQRLQTEFDILEVINAPDFAQGPCALLGVSW